MATSATRDHADTELQSMIDEHGWAVIGVYPTVHDDGVPFAYTVGLTAKKLPELAIYGLGDPVNSAVILNTVAQRMIDRGELRGGERLEGVLAEGFTLAVLDMGDVSDLTAVQRFYGGIPAARQLVWPDPEGRMPWEGWSCADATQPLSNWPPF
jgi:hypothetical protein